MSWKEELRKIINNIKGIPEKELGDGVMNAVFDILRERPYYRLIFPKKEKSKNIS